MQRPVWEGDEAECDQRADRRSERLDGREA